MAWTLKKNKIKTRLQDQDHFSVITNTKTSHNWSRGVNVNIINLIILYKMD